MILKLKAKYVYFIVAILAIAAVAYPVLYSQFLKPNLSADPYICAPLIPCQKPPRATTVCPPNCTITIGDGNFNPPALNVTAGATVIWINQDGFPHTSTSLNSSYWSSPVIPAGHHFDLTLPKNWNVGQTIYYDCTIHNQMIGSITIVSNSTS
jgi:plastocyanin